MQDENYICFAAAEISGGSSLLWSQDNEYLLWLDSLHLTKIHGRKSVQSNRQSTMIFLYPSEEDADVLPHSICLYDCSGKEPSRTDNYKCRSGAAT